MFLVGSAGEVVLHVLGVTRHTSSMALLVYFLTFLPKSLIQVLVDVEYLISDNPYQDLFPADSTE